MLCRMTDAVSDGVSDGVTDVADGVPHDKNVSFHRFSTDALKPPNHFLLGGTGLLSQELPAKLCGH